MLPQCFHGDGMVDKLVALLLTQPSWPELGGARGRFITASDIAQISFIVKHHVPIKGNKEINLSAKPTFAILTTKPGCLFCISSRVHIRTNDTSLGGNYYCDDAHLHSESDMYSQIDI